MNVICKEVPAEHLVLGRWVKHIKKGKVYTKEEYNFGEFPYVDLIDHHPVPRRVLSMRKKDFDTYFEETLICTFNPPLSVP